ncbi:hypothetical protein [Propionivibrio sp.]|uniref:hypothetical protein n=1 Tax=Propionivibrio sp. TaxID=2212460 RepID=UPI00263414E1|nr:hypothetical protein [Propionivibrio sp.]
MRVKALGAYRMTGIAKASGKAYDMGKLVIEVPVENMATPKMTRVGYGSTTNELDVAPESVAKFNFHYPLELDLEVDQVIQFGSLQAIIVGARPVAVVKAA